MSLRHPGAKRKFSACSLVGFWAGLSWLVLICCERKILLTDWFQLTETNKRKGKIVKNTGDSLGGSELL